MKTHLASVLIIDDDQTLLELLSEHLQASGYRPFSAANGAKGLELLSDADPQLIILDVMMPEMTGWEVCQQIRSFSDVPILMLTARGEEFDKLRGFRLGVDDYVTKPFSFSELVARIKAILARSSRQALSGRRITSGELAVDFDQRRVTLGDKPVDLTPNEFRLLAAMARSPNRTIPTEQLVNEVWGTDKPGDLDHVKHFIWTLRKKIEADPGAPKHIITERGYGYRFE
jgi:DNA-binding response OmpR family regulator